MAEQNTLVAERTLPSRPDKPCDVLADYVVSEVRRADPYGQRSIEAASAFDHVNPSGNPCLPRRGLPDEFRLNVTVHTLPAVHAWWRRVDGAIVPSRFPHCT